MIMNMFALKDRIKGFAPPIPFVTDTKEEATELAKRDFFERFCTNTTVHYAPADFELWYVGTFDTASGTYIQNPSELQCILKGEDLSGENNKRNQIQKTL